ncbi:MAG: PKD domain-containing protein [Fluviicola sp.]|nr:PKD domain-containing protein [Fluviicola sp.]
MKLLKYIILALLLSNVSASKLQAQIDTLFWFAPPWVTPDHDNNVQLAFRISTFGNAATVRMQQPALLFDTTFVVPANSLADVPLDYLVNSLESTPADAILTSGMKITSTELITVVYDFISDLITISPGSPNNPETYSLKGQNGMGLEFVTPFQTIWNNRALSTDRNGDGTVTQPKQYFSIVATEDNTTVYIKPNCDVIGHPADITYSIVLPLAGNVYTCENVTLITSAPGDNLSGSVVFADKPISITINDDSVNPAGGGGCFDLMGDQIVPTDVIGNEYIVNIGFLNAGSNESIFIIPAENFTTVTVTDGGTTTQMMNQGETWQYSITDPLTHIIADKPLYLVHMSGYGCELGMAILPPLNCAGSNEVSFARNNNQQFLLNLLCAAGDEGSFTLTGPGTGTVTAASFAPVPGTGGAWVGAQIDYTTAEIPSGTQNTLTNSAGFFSMGVINGGPATGCLYHYMSSFHRRVITEAGVDTTLCNGVPTVDLNGTVTGGTTTGIWTVLDGTGTISNPTTLVNTYAPTTSDYNQGYLTFVLASTGNCTPVTDTMRVTYIQSPIVDAGLDDGYCKNNIGAVPISGSVNFAAGANWTGGNGGAFGNPGSLATTYTPSPADIAQDSVILVLSSAGSFFSCPNDNDTVVIRFTQAPAVIAGADAVLCSNTSTINLNGLVSGATSTGIWTTNGAGAFSPTSTAPITDYLVSSADTTAGTISLVLTSTNNGNCLAEQDSIQITFLAEPSLTITSADSICSNLALLSLDGTISVGYTPTWTTGGFGSIVAPNSISTQYNITAVDTAQGYVDFYLESNAGICPTTTDSLRIYFIDPPAVFAGLDQNFCDNAVIQVNGSVTGISSVGNWTTLGTGTWSPGANFPVTTYIPSALDIANGSVDLTLSSTSVFGCAPNSDVVTITFLSSPTADFSATMACAGQNTVFTDGSTGSVTNWDWDFGDADTSIVSNPTHTYTGSGNYTTTLIAYSSNGCSDTTQQVIVVNPVPIADFSPTAACENIPINLTDLSFISGGLINSWMYDFGGGASSTDQHPTYTFTGSGLQQVTLTVTSTLGCVDDTTINFSITPAPIADFTFTPDQAIVQEQVNFTDISVGNGIYQWLWEFGDGQGNNVQNPVHSFNDGGTFDVMLIITDANGCIDTAVHSILIGLPPVLPTGFTPNGDGENDIFYIRGGPFETVSFNVYNKWGELIFSATEADFITDWSDLGWDGTFQGEPVPLGVYTWTFVVEQGREIHKKTGDVTLMR